MKQVRRFYQQPRISVYSVATNRLMSLSGEGGHSGNRVKDWEDSSNNTEDGGTFTF